MATMREVQSNWTEITNRLLHDKGEMLQFLRFSANLYKLPFSNAALVYRENPNIQYIASATQWNHSGRYVRSGEHGITVFDETPSQNALLFLFDVSQTDNSSTPVTWQLTAAETPEICKLIGTAHQASYATAAELCSGLVEHYLQTPRIQTEIRSHMNAMRLNAMGMPSIAMWMQCGLVTVFILLVSFGGGTASAFFNKLTLMANVSMTLPYLFLALAFPFFKARQDLDRPFVIFKTRMSAMIATVVVVLVVTFANVFTIIQPVVEAGDWDSTLWMIGGPVFFSLLAMAIY